MTNGEDHPRVRGEKQVEVTADDLNVGSPPRARGKVPLALVVLSLPGITPACAGKSHSFGGVRVGTWDHPRVRGEKPTVPGDIDVLEGSPPRARGKGGVP